MSGVCGWSNNQLTLDIGSSIINDMISKLLINKTHTSKSIVNEFCSLATVGLSGNSDVCLNNNIVVAIEGSVRWLDKELSEMSTSKGLAYSIGCAYAQEDVGFLRKLSGGFALSLIDITKRITIIAIDKLGIGSLFFSSAQEQFLFSSNARSILCHPNIKGDISSQSVFDYLYFHMVPSPRSIFSEMEKLLPGEYVKYEHGKITRQFYWQPRYNESNIVDIHSLEQEFMEILESTVRRAASDAFTGAFLSGGTDSSTISGMLGKIRKTPINTYSIGFDVKGFDETEYARIAARHFKTIPHEYYLTPQDVVDAVPIIANAYDEPFGNASAIPAYYCAKLAKDDGMTALLAGDGGDEIFAGNVRYAKQKVFELYLQIPKILRDSIIEPTAMNFPFGDNLWPIHKIRSYINQANILLPDRLESYNYLNRIPLKNIFEEDFLIGININEPSDFLGKTYNEAPTISTLNKMLYLDLKFTLADNDLRKVNRMCDLANIKVKYPLLDEELVAFSANLPISLKINNYRLRFFFKKALKNFLPKEILNKQKHGFGLPFGLWMNGNQPLNDLAFKSIISLSKRGIVKQSFISSIQNDHKKNPGYYGVMIWVMMMLEQWFISINK